MIRLLFGWPVPVEYGPYKPPEEKAFFNESTASSSSSPKVLALTQASYTFDLRKNLIITVPTSRLSERAKDLLGPNAVGRFESFLRYQDGWDFGEGRSMSRSSVAVMESFLNRFKGFSGKSPSLFLTRSGNPQLAWEDEEGNTLELEFFADRIEFYLERDGEEGTVFLSQIEELITRI